MESAALVLAVVGGFIFSDRFKVTQLRIARATGYELAFLSILSAFVFFQASCLILYPFFSPTWTLEGFVDLWLNPIDNRLDREIPRDLLGSLLLFKDNLIPASLCAFAVGAVAWYPANKIVSWFWLDIDLYARLITRYGSELDRLLLSSVAAGRQIQITLDNGKVYTGAIVQLPRLRRAERDQLGLMLVVSRSGYRDEKTHKLCFTTDYQWIYDPKAPLASIGELETFIPLQRIVSATYFDPNLYDHFQRQPPPPTSGSHVPWKRRKPLAP